MKQARITRQEQKENTRRDILSAAIGLFARQGIAATTTADIARTHDVSHGTIFLHFPTRDDLLQAVVDDFGAKLAKSFDSALAAEKSVKGVLRAHLRVLAECEDFYFRLLTETYALPEGIRATLFMLNNAVSHRLNEAALKEPAVKKMERPQLFNTWMAIVSYHVMHRDLLSDKRPILKEKEKELIQHFINLIEK